MYIGRRIRENRARLRRRLGVGLDNIDLDACAGRAVAVHLATGAIGRAVAQRATALGMDVAACDPMLPLGDPAWSTPGVRRFDDLDAMLGASDVVTLHVPLTGTTRHLVGADAIAAMKHGACIVNTARGGVLDETAMAEALASGRLGAAALDVFEDEPLPAHSPLVGVPNLYLTPHIAGLTEEANVRTGELVASRIRSALSSAH